MREIMDCLDRMLKYTVAIDRDNPVQQAKDQSKRILGESIDMVLTQMSPQVINKLVIDEMRKINNKKMGINHNNQ